MSHLFVEYHFYEFVDGFKFKPDINFFEGAIMGVTVEKLSPFFSVYFPADAVAHLKLISERTYFEDDQSIVRIALFAYEQIIDLHAQNLRLEVRNHVGDVFKYTPFDKFEYPELTAQKIKFDEQAEILAASLKRKRLLFSHAAIERMTALQAKSYASSLEDVIRIALSAFKELILIDEMGGQFRMVASEGRTYPYNPLRPFCLERTPI